MAGESPARQPSGDDPPHDDDVLSDNFDFDKHFAGSNYAPSDAGSTFDDDGETNTLGRHICDVKGQTLDGHTFRHLITSKARMAEHIGLTGIDFGNIVVNDPIIQEIFLEFKNNGKQFFQDVKRSGSFITFFDSVSSGGVSRYATASQTELNSFSPSDYELRYYCRLYSVLHDRPDGIIHTYNGGPSALWACVYCIGKVILAFNKTTKKRDGARKAIQKHRDETTKKIIASHTKIKTSRASLLGKGGDLVNIQKDIEKKQSGKSKGQTKGARKSKAINASPVSKPIGVGEKHSHQPSEGPSLGDFDPSQYDALEIADIAKTFTIQQDLDDTANRQKNAPRIQRHARDLADCAREMRLPENTHRDKQYKMLSKVLYMVTRAFFEDFQHINIAKIRKQVLTELVKVTGAQPARPTNCLEDPEPLNESAITAALDLEEAQASKERARVLTSTVAHRDLKLPPASARARKLAASWKTILNSPLFQPDNLKEAVIDLGIPNDRFKVMPGQNPTISLRWWQVLNAKYNSDRCHGYVDGINGAFTGDVVGSGKTFEISATILHVSPSLWRCS